MTAHEKMEWLAWTSCSAGLVIVALCLLPGWIEVREPVSGIRERLGKGTRKRGGAHRLAEDPPAPTDPGGTGTDPSQPAGVQ